jgi:small subunit ribosomal protein S4
MKLGPRYKIAKRLGAPIFEKTQTQKFQLSQARSQKAKGKRMRRGGSEYRRQLIEKQKLRLIYGLSEKQFGAYVREALQNHQSPQETLFQSLESRLDSVVYRMGLAKTRRAARQMVSHGHIIVNGKRVTIPSLVVSPKDAIAVREGSRTSPLFANTNERLSEYTFPHWVTFNSSDFTGVLKEMPLIADHDTAVDIGAVFEYYTR